MTQNNTFNPNEHLMKIKNKGGATDYLPVQWRLVWFREQCPEGTIETEEIVVDLDREVEREITVWENNKPKRIIKQARGYARYKAIVTDGKGGKATGTKTENAAEFPDFVEKAETGAIGRALAGLGYGTQFAPELDESHRIVDAPVDRSQTPAQPQPNITPVQQAQETHAQATVQQLASIDKLCQFLEKPVPNAGTLNYDSAKELIARLNAEVKDVQEMRRQNAKGLPPVPEQSKPMREMIAKAKARAGKIDMLWPDVKTDAKLANVSDETLSVQQVAHINAVLKEYEDKLAPVK